MRRGPTGLRRRGSPERFADVGPWLRAVATHHSISNLRRKSAPRKTSLLALALGTLVIALRWLEFVRAHRSLQILFQKIPHRNPYDRIVCPLTCSCVYDSCARRS